MIIKIIACVMLGIFIGVAFLFLIGDVILLAFTDNPFIGFVWMTLTIYGCYLLSKRIFR